MPHIVLLGFDWYIIPPSSAMFRRAVVDAVGGFREPWGAGDLDFYLRAARVFSAWCYEEPTVTRYRRYSASSSRDGERMLRSIRAVYARQWPLVDGDPAGEAAFQRGLALLTGIFIDCLAENVRDRLHARVAAGAPRRSATRTRARRAGCSLRNAGGWTPDSHEAVALPLAAHAARRSAGDVSAHRARSGASGDSEAPVGGAVVTRVDHVTTARGSPCQGAMAERPAS